MKIGILLIVAAVKSDKCALFQGSCDNFQFRVSIDEVCKAADWNSLELSSLYIDGPDGEGAEEHCRFAWNNNTNAWEIEINVNDCGSQPITDADFMTYPFVIRATGFEAVEPEEMLYWNNTDFNENNLEVAVEDSLESCIQRCLANEQCVAFTFDTLNRHYGEEEGQNCWLKSRAENYGVWTDLVGGFRASLDSAPDMPTHDGSYTVGSSGSDFIYREPLFTSAELSCQYERRANFSQGGWQVVSDDQTIQVDTIETTNARSLSSVFNFNIEDPQISSRAANSSSGIELGTFLPFKLSVSLQNSSDIFDYRIDECWATPTSDSNIWTQFTLAENGCATESWITISKDEVQFNLFAFFSFDQFYLHCGILICDVNDDDCQQQQCGATGRRRRSNDEAEVVSSSLMLDPDSYANGHVVETRDGLQLIMLDEDEAQQTGEIIRRLPSGAKELTSGLFVFVIILFH